MHYVHVVLKNDISEKENWRMLKILINTLGFYSKGSVQQWPFPLSFFLFPFPFSLFSEILLELHGNALQSKTAGCIKTWHTDYALQ